MMWNQPPGWESMLEAVVAGLGVPDGGVVTAGSAVLGTVVGLRASRSRDHLGFSEKETRP